MRGVDGIECVGGEVRGIPVVSGRVGCSVCDIIEVDSFTCILGCLCCSINCSFHKKADDDLYVALIQMLSSVQGRHFAIYG